MFRLEGVSRLSVLFLPRLFFASATALVAIAAYVCFTAPSFHHHIYNWKNALAFVEKNAVADNALVLICSDIREADHADA